ncbi:hypothetical protein HF329_09620 [Chitinophaga oryzae]|uniref:Uncharacterized protein n=1 Tax=Chitinophaga oryzae TaxID=2725414 RepID=A0AAE6ZG27_9BACT|nr:hypothetical protein [Chitinophaga oryzae]QJB31552.1 hypothetical protein HF329_09620 [Chitinophaga oryzae]
MKVTSKVAIKQVTAGKAEEHYKDKILSNPQLEEHIIVIGTQQFNHSLLGAIKRGFDAGPNGKFMFIHQAIRRIRLNPELNWTVVIYKEGYTANQIGAMSVALANIVNGIRVVQAARREHVINYINTQDGNNEADTSDVRKIVKVKRLLFYCHGLVNRLAIGITNLNTTDDMLDITHNAVQQLNRDAFFPDARIYCFSCRTGLGNPQIDTSVYKTDFWGKETTERHNLYSAQSLAQKFSDITKVITYAYLCRSDYEDTLFTPDELDFIEYYRAGQFGVKRSRKNDGYNYLLKKEGATEQDHKRYKMLEDVSNARTIVDGAVFDPAGARYNVKGGESPKGLPREMQTFSPLQ